ncbi:mucin-2-like [Paramacrobiotus metropolitanus]|uniref:mucin-2-like n=1 Tax=Paramacrobiotus metropolitanus TaxID=2943436 RepID=UPI0024458425|nr:mucin-2-like [Paramacrobiotus metropolitanus]
MDSPMKITSKSHSELRTVITLLLLGATSIKRFGALCEKSERAVCPLPTPCYRWANLNGGSCDFGTEIQLDNTATGIDICPNWFRGYRYFPYQFDLVENYPNFDEKILDVIALSRCTRRPFGAAPESQDAVAVLKSPNIGVTSCTVWRVTFWYRLSDYPVFDSVNPQNQFHLQVFVEDYGHTFPIELIWGREEDYDGVLPNVWKSVEAVFHRDQSEPYVLYWFAYHNDNCEVSLKEIAVDSIRIQYATTATPASGICPTTTEASPETTPPSTPTPVVPDTTPPTTPFITTAEPSPTTSVSSSPTDIADTATTSGTTTVYPEQHSSTPSTDTTISTSTPLVETDTTTSETTPSTATGTSDTGLTTTSTTTVPVKPGTEAHEPNETTSVSEETISIPEETTPGPEETTPIPEDTTPSLTEITQEPSSTTPKPTETVPTPSEETTSEETISESDESTPTSAIESTTPMTADTTTTKETTTDGVSGTSLDSTETSVTLDTTLEETTSNSTAISYDYSSSTDSAVTACPIQNSPCVDWMPLGSSTVNKLNCGFGIRQQRPDELNIVMCRSWNRTIPWLNFVFDIVTSPTETKNFAVSRCSRRSGVSVVRPEAVAAIITPPVQVSESVMYNISFRYMLSAPPDFDSKYFFDVRIGRPNEAAIPSESSIIWGKPTDYPTDFANLTNQFLYNSTTYTVGANGSFNVHFIAHHNDGCRINRATISIDDIVTKQAKEKACPTTPPPTTPWTTTPSPKLCADLMCASWIALPQSESSKLVCSFGPYQGVWYCRNWDPKFTWLRHRFDVAQRASKNMQAVSQCSVGTSSARVVGKAVLRTPVVTVAACVHYNLTFIIQFSHAPVISDNELESYFLDVRIGNGSESRIPDRVIWGSTADYAKDNINMGNYTYTVTTAFAIAENDSFTINFVAHHSNQCTTRGQSIAIDDIVTRKGAETDICETTTTAGPRDTTSVDGSGKRDDNSESDRRFDNGSGGR